MMNYLFSCDWGTSALRVRLLELPTLAVLDEEYSNLGVARVHEDYKNYRLDDSEGHRTMFYAEVLRKGIESISKRLNLFVGGVPVMLSGMASSSIGMMELPYADLPFSVSGEKALVHRIGPIKGFNHPIMLVSGLRVGDEVMRGEETQLVGISDILGAIDALGDSLVILPGTHSKHVEVREAAIARIDTYLTGELFAILSQNGLIREAVEAHDRTLDGLHLKFFLEGVEDAGGDAFLGSLFKVRTNQLFGRVTKEVNYSYLSGLLIGNEVRTVLARDYPKIILCCGSKLHAHYRQALLFLGLESKCHFIDPIEAEQATCKGQWLIAKNYVNDRD